MTLNQKQQEVDLHDEVIVTFERGIIWQGDRISEKWLNDAWLKEGSY